MVPKVHPEPYLSLMHRKNLIFNGKRIKVYDCRPQSSTYIYRDVERRKYTLIDKVLVKKCMARIVNYLNYQFPAPIESEECRKVCRQPKKRFFVAVLLLHKFQGKIWKSKSAGKECLQLKEKRKLKFQPSKADKALVESFHQTQSIQVSTHKTAVWMEKDSQENEETCERTVSTAKRNPRSLKLEVSYAR